MSGMKQPPTLAEAQARGLLTADDKGIHTFSNSDTWFSFAARNCDECRFWSEDVAGQWCAFEAAAFLHRVSPDLARLFGWTASTKYADSWDEPEQCAFFRRSDDDGERGPLPDPDPAQLVLIADPTEDAALLTAVDLPELVEVAV
jgi:hypothetical protein